MSYRSIIIILGTFFLSSFLHFIDNFNNVVCKETLWSIGRTYTRLRHVIHFPLSEGKLLFCVCSCCLVAEKKGVGKGKVYRKWWEWMDFLVWNFEFGSFPDGIFEESMKKGKMINIKGKGGKEWSKSTGFWRIMFVWNKTNPMPAAFICMCVYIYMYVYMSEPGRQERERNSRQGHEDQ